MRAASEVLGIRFIRSNIQDNFSADISIQNAFIQFNSVNLTSPQDPPATVFIGQRTGGSYFVNNHKLHEAILLPNRVQQNK